MLGLFTNRRYIIIIMMIVFLLTTLVACSNAESNSPSSNNLTKVTIALDWTPNTNHTGLYVARDLGFFKQHGLEVEILPYSEAGADQLVASGAVNFGVSYQENITAARVKGVPLVSIAAIIQHNTSGFASPATKKIKRPADFEGHTYGGWGAPVEEAMLKSLMAEDEGDFSKVKIVNTGVTDYFTQIQNEIDFAWIYYGWTGIEASLKGLKQNMIYLSDYSKDLDYYTPILATNEQMIKDNPTIISKFVAGATQGYQFAIDNPDSAAAVLLKAEPDLNGELVKASQRWLASRYQADAQRWGEQKLSVWQNYAKWMSKHQLLEGDFDATQAFTNDFLPGKQGR